jgi:AhpD family alkylhydroperoxidase
MAGPGELDPLTRELIYVAVSVTNGCDYCIASHRAAAVSKGMTETMYGELMSVVPTANMTNRLANGFQVPLDEKFKQPV